MDDPDCAKLCGWSALDSQVMIAQPKKVNTQSLLLDADDRRRPNYVSVAPART